VLVTHDIEEAVFLASDLIMLSSRPARVGSRLVLDFGQRYAAGEPVRRIKSDPAFIQKREQVLSWLFEQGEHSDG
jgi:taurine transport system ATP-binding protein